MRNWIRLILVCVLIASVVSLVSNSSGQPPQCQYGASGALPDPSCTPGAINHAVTQATIGKTICVPGWTTSIRPDVRVTEPEKLVSMRQYGYAFGTSPSNYEYDHLIPLELGGAANDLKNLFPEPHHVRIGNFDQGSFMKDKTENKLHYMVCHGQMKLWSARKIMRVDWRTGD
jgi:hypothetical protein